MLHYLVLCLILLAILCDHLASSNPHIYRAMLTVIILSGAAALVACFFVFQWIIFFLWIPYFLSEQSNKSLIVPKLGTVPPPTVLFNENSHGIRFSQAFVDIAHLISYQCLRGKQEPEFIQVTKIILTEFCTKFDVALTRGWISPNVSQLNGRHPVWFWLFLR